MSDEDLRRIAIRHSANINKHGGAYIHGFEVEAPPDNEGSNATPCVYDKLLNHVNDFLQA